MKIGAFAFRSFFVAAAVAAAMACVGEESAPPLTVSPEAGASSSSGGTDAANPDDGGHPDDAGEPLDARPRCDPDGSFVDLAPLEGDVNAGTAEHPTLTDDELDIFFNSNARADAALHNEIFTAHRSKITEAFGTAVLVKSVSTTNQEAHPAISGDGLLLFYVGQVPGDGHFTLAFATRTDRSVDFDKPTVGGLGISSNANDSRPFLTLDKSALYFASDRPGTSGPSDIYVSKASGAGFVSASPLAAPINSPADESNGVLTADGLTLYLERDNKILRAHRATPDGVFDDPKPVDELNTAGTQNQPGWISRDQCRLYFRTNRSTQMLWLATRNPLP